MIRPIANKWQFRFRIDRSLTHMDSAGWRVFELWLVNLKRIPEQGEQIRKSDYRGFVLKFRFWLPVDSAW